MPATRRRKLAPVAALPTTPGRACRWPRRDLLTGAPVDEEHADVRSVTDFEWRGAVASKRATEYGPVVGGGISRELRDWTARSARIAEAAEEAS